MTNVIGALIDQVRDRPTGIALKVGWELGTELPKSAPATTARLHKAVEKAAGQLGVDMGLDVQVIYASALLAIALGGTDG